MKTWYLVFCWKSVTRLDFGHLILLVLKIYTLAIYQQKLLCHFRNVKYSMDIITVIFLPGKKVHCQKNKNIKHEWCKSEPLNMNNIRI